MSHARIHGTAADARCSARTSGDRLHLSVCWDDRRVRVAFSGTRAELERLLDAMADALDVVAGG
jgi:hypothetical protein